MSILFKTLIVILFFANIAVLGRALYTMMNDQGKKSDRTANLLMLRVTLAVALLAVCAVGLMTGHLGASAPWLQYAQP